MAGTKILSRSTFFVLIVHSIAQEAMNKIKTRSLTMYSSMANVSASMTGSFNGWTRGDIVDHISDISGWSGEGVGWRRRL